MKTIEALIDELIQAAQDAAFAGASGPEDAEHERLELQRLRSEVVQRVGAKTLGAGNWTIISRNERSLTRNGKHYFAVRCSRQYLWTIEELDGPIESNTSRRVRVVAKGVETRQLLKTLIAESGSCAN